MNIYEIEDRYHIPAKDIKRVLEGAEESTLEKLLEMFYIDDSCLIGDIADMQGHIKTLEKIIDEQRDIIKKQNTFLRLTNRLVNIIPNKKLSTYLQSIFHLPKPDNSENNFGFVYIAKQLNARHTYKIGMTKDIDRREKDFATGNLFIKIISYKYIMNPRTYEADLHFIFRNNRILNEWFRFSDNECKLLIKEFQFDTMLEYYFEDSLNDYLDILENDRRRIEACHNIIKICKRIAAELQEAKP
jgi:hypothetical protein